MRHDFKSPLSVLCFLHDPARVGGAEEDRTPDLQSAILALYQIELPPQPDATTIREPFSKGKKILIHQAIA